MEEGHLALHSWWREPVVHGRSGYLAEEQKVRQNLEAERQSDLVVRHEGGWGHSTETEQWFDYGLTLTLAQSPMGRPVVICEMSRCSLWLDRRWTVRIVRSIAIPSRASGRLYSRTYIPVATVLLMRGGRLASSVWETSGRRSLGWWRSRAVRRRSCGT